MAVKPAGQGDGAPGEIRTPDRLVRSITASILYSIDLKIK
jgi:hypothetical protein